MTVNPRGQRVNMQAPHVYALLGCEPWTPPAMRWQFHRLHHRATHKGEPDKHTWEELGYWRVFTIE